VRVEVNGCDDLHGSQNGVKARRRRHDHGYRCDPGRQVQASLDDAASGGPHGHGLRSSGAERVEGSGCDELYGRLASASVSARAGRQHCDCGFGHGLQATAPLSPPLQRHDHQHARTSHGACARLARLSGDRSNARHHGRRC